MSDAPTAAAPQPGRVARLLSLVRQLIDYGKHFAAALHSNPVQHGGSDIAAILARITRGLLRAEALEARISRNAARLDADRRPRSAASRRTPHAAQHENNVPQTGEGRPGLTGQSASGCDPTPEQI